MVGLVGVLALVTALASAWHLDRWWERRSPRVDRASGLRLGGVGMFASLAAFILLFVLVFGVTDSVLPKSDRTDTLRGIALFILAIPVWTAWMFFGNMVNRSIFAQHPNRVDARSVLVPPDQRIRPRNRRRHRPR